jgi:hypothetical protein
MLNTALHWLLLAERAPQTLVTTMKYCSSFVTLVRLVLLVLWALLAQLALLVQLDQLELLGLLELRVRLALELQA